MGINFSKFIENRVNNIKASDKLAFASAIGVGPWVAPAAPAIIFGYSLWKSAPGDMGIFRIITAVAVAVGLVVAGAVSSHNAVLSKNVRSWLLVIGYISLEIFGLWMMAVSFEVKAVGTVAALLTLIVYLSRTDANEIDQAKSERDQARAKSERDEDRAISDAKDRDRAEFEFKVDQAKLDAEHRREEDSLATARKHDVKLAGIGAKTVSREVSKPVKEVSNFDVKYGDFDTLNEDFDTSGVNFDTTNIKRRASKKDNIREMERLLTSDPGLKTTELASRLSVTRQTIHNYRKQIAKRNGLATAEGDGSDNELQARE